MEAGVPRTAAPLVGRTTEREEIDQLLARARGGMSGVLVLRGEPGIGKTALLDDAASSASDFDVVRLVGIESEMRLGFAALHQLLMPFLDDLDSLPPPQRRALGAAFGLSDDAAPDQFLVGLAALTLLATAATRTPLLVIVDDTQWLDQDSADALGFVARRLHADQVCLFVAMRETFDDRHLFDGLPSLTIAPLSDAASVALLDTSVRGPVAGHVRDRILADARGNPLALVEFGRELSFDQLAGTERIPEPLAVDRTFEGHFRRQVNALPSATQTLLLVAAAEPNGDDGSVWRASRDLDFDEQAIVPAQDAGLLEPGSRIAFRHPIIRSSVYQGASLADRCRVHEALAEAGDAERDRDGSAWHRAAAAQVPDEEVAAELEQAAHRAGSRGSCAASAALLARAAELTPDRSRRAIRWFSAAASDLAAGSASRADAHLTLARPDLQAPVLVAQARQLEATIAYINAFPERPTDDTALGRVGDIVPMMLDAARTLEPLDLQLARAAALDAIPMSLYFGEASGTPTVEVAQVARTLRLPPDATPTTADLIFDALAELFAEGFESAGPLLRQALDAAREDPEIPSAGRYATKACFVAFALGDDQALGELAGACVTTSRELGAYQVVPEALGYLGLRQLRVGSLNGADEVYDELIETDAVLGRNSSTCRAGRLLVTAWRGREEETRAEAAALAHDGQVLAYVVRLAEHALTVLELGLGNYQAAAGLGREDWQTDLSLGTLRAADAVEAHVRSGDPAAARPALDHLGERASANQSPLDLGLASRSRALLARDADAEAHYRESLTQLETSGAKLHLARTHLVYGEWLRRQKRRRDAREQLGAACDIFESMGATAFADRARSELLATGANARKRVDETRLDLTPQEAQIARLAAGGLTNPEIAARLFLSASTVDYHLRKVYRKLDITSRHDLREVLPAN